MNVFKAWRPLKGRILSLLAAACGVALGAITPLSAASVTAAQTAVAPTAPPTSTCAAVTPTPQALPLASLIPLLDCQWRQRRLLIVGEMHGSNETPGLIGELIQAQPADRPIRLGLEWLGVEEPRFRRYLSSAGSEADKQALFEGKYGSHPDGRSSQAMFALIDHMRQWRRQGRDVDIFLMEPDYADKAAIAATGGDTQYKETGMAGAIRRSMASAPQQALVVALMGNLHTRDRPAVGLPPSSVTLQLRDLKPMVLAPMSMHGGSWNCTSSCGPHYQDAVTTSMSAAPIDIKAQPDAPAGLLVDVLRLPSLTPSFPAKTPSSAAPTTSAR